MDPRSQRMLLAMFIMIMIIVLYKDFGESGTVQSMAQHAASVAGRKAKDVSQHMAFKPANATLGVS